MKIQFINSENVGNPIYGSRSIKNARQLIENKILKYFSGIDNAATSLENYDSEVRIRREGKRTVADLAIGQFSMAFVLSRDNDSWKLLEIRKPGG